MEANPNFSERKAGGDRLGNYSHPAAGPTRVRAHAHQRDDGMVYLTFTPLKGMSDVVHAFIQEYGQL